jgi:hypothetical protein
MNNSPQSWRAKKIAWALIGLLSFASLAFVVWAQPFRAPVGSPLEHTSMTDARHSPRDVVGDLGGVAVNIPRHFANFVEYEGDPGWGEKRQSPRPERTHQSKLVSFGYYVRFPDMAGESTPDLVKDRRSYSPSKTPWIRVGITTGNIYPGNGFLDRRASYVRKTEGNLEYEQYEQLPDSLHGLTVYAAGGIDPHTNKPYREHADASDVFLHREKTARVDSYIKCSNRNVPAPPCRHDFSLEPRMNAQVYVSYRRSELAHWREIQQAVTQQILGFKAPQANPIGSKP